MKFITVVDDQGQEQHINAALVLSVKARVRTELGSVIRFANGTSLTVVESTQDVLNQLGVTTAGDIPL